MTANQRFIPGKQLANLFYAEAVQPLLADRFPRLQYAAGLLDYGSEVLGFDTPMSRDHHWGPRVQLFVSERDHKYRTTIDRLLSRELPASIAGYSTSFSHPDDRGIQMPERAAPGKIRHRVEITTIRSFFEQYLGCNPGKKLALQEWLVFPEQRLATVRYGAVFHDGLGLNRIRERLHYFPDDVWRYLMASQWRRIEQEEPFMGRCGDGGDELGSRIIAARLVRDLMRLCFLMEREYIPYTKWLGTAFSRLRCGPDLSPVFIRILSAPNWKQREKALAAATKIIGRMHNNLGITKPLPIAATRFHDRPFLVIHGELFAEAIHSSIRNKKLKNIKLIGSIDQFADSTDVLDDIHLTTKLGSIFQAAATRGTL